MEKALLEDDNQNVSINYVKNFTDEESLLHVHVLQLGNKNIVIPCHYHRLLQGQGTEKLF